MLKALMLRKKIDSKKKELAAVVAAADELQKREAELEKDIAEAETDEEKTAVDEAITEFEKDSQANKDAQSELEKEIAGLETELAEIEKEQDTTPAAAPAEQPAENERTNYGGGKMTFRNKVFNSMSTAERSAMFQNEKVQNFLGEVRACIREKRAITNVGLTIPEEFLGLIRENLINYSKLYKHVFVRPMSGNGRLVVMGALPEAVWTDCCANINELDLVFNDVEFGCWKVAGYFAICNANIEDSDIDLAAEVLTAIGQAIGLSLDKAILYGTGTRMPLGIVTRLVQTEKPAGYPVTARPWEDLHSSNITPINSSGMTAAQLISAIVTASGAAKNKYSRGEKVWVMSEKTYTKLMAATVSVDAEGRIVSGIADRMPVVGGVIEVLDFIPENIIIGGYFDLYHLAERAGAQFMTSEHVRFLQDQTVFKGTARYDGQPVIAEAFVVVSLLNTAVSAGAVSFADDTANTATGIVLAKEAVTVTASTGTQHTAKLVVNTIPEGQAVTFTSADTSKATVSSTGVITGVGSGTTTVTVASNVAQAFCAVTIDE